MLAQIVVWYRHSLDPIAMLRILALKERGNGAQVLLAM